MNMSGGFRHASSERSFAMCFDYHERLAWIRRIEQMEKKLKEAELAKAAAGKKVAEGRQTAPQPDAQEQPVPA
jgi:hypothetical protein